MFSGIVRGVGAVRRVEAVPGFRRLEITAGGLRDSWLEPGRSVAVAGVCLTVAAHTPGGFQADVSPETESRTTLGGLQPGARVNLEPPLRLSDFVDGHLVAGHVDAVAEVMDLVPAGASLRVVFSAPEPVRAYLAVKGSIAVDGVSLTVNSTDTASFSVNIIPYTRESTTLGALEAGARVNLEADLIARYLERLSTDTHEPG